MSKETLQHKTCKELRELAKNLNIQGRWNMTKERLIEAILGVENAMDSESNKVMCQSTTDEHKVDNHADDSRAEHVEAESKVEKDSAGMNMEQKMSYIENVKVGTIVAFRLSNGRVKSAKVTKKSTKNRRLRLETSYGAEYIASYDDIVWVRTGKRWPRGVYNLLKGIVDDGCKGKEQSRA